MISSQIKQLIQKVAHIDFEPDLTVPEVKKFGHYSTNLALRLAKQRSENPIKLAQSLASELLKQGEGMFQAVEALPPGFINFTLSDQFLQEQLRAIAKTPFPKMNLGKGKKVIIDFIGPNIAKPLHVGHLRSTIIGSALSNVYEALGYKVIGWNYIGDWGTQFGKLLAAYKLWGNKSEVEKDPIKSLLALYVRFHDIAKTDLTLEKKGQEEFLKLERGDKENRKLWKWFKKESLRELYSLLKLLNVKPGLPHGEAYYEKELPRILKKLKNSIAKQSEGAWVIPLDQFQMPPALIEKSDGATLYLTRDIASLQDRLTHTPAKILYVVANQQALHFEQLFAVAKLLGLNSAELVHVKFGMVLGSDGKKLATREGKVVQLMDVMSEGIQRAYAVVSAKNPDLSEKEKQAVAKAVSIGALKYNDLKENRNSDIQFNWEKMLDLNGDTAPYLQYTYARLQSIIRKSGNSRSNVLKNVGTSLARLDQENELSIIKKILDLPDVVVLCAHTYLTSHLAKYLYELAKLVNAYYETTHITSDQDAHRRNARLVLIQAAAATLKKGLELLGVTTLERI